MRSLPNRKLNRLTGYDYSQAGFYFITICVHNRECVFGEISGGKMVLAAAGQIAHDCWSEIPRHFTGASLDEFVVMPNHIHGIIVINDETGNVIVENGFADAVVVGNATVVGNAIVGNAYMRSLRRPPSSRLPQPPPPNNDRTKMLIPQIIQQYKSAVTRNINHLPGGLPFRWQKSYYDHIVRDREALERIRHYIRNNPAKWESDIENNKFDIFNEEKRKAYYTDLDRDKFLNNENYR